MHGFFENVLEVSFGEATHQEDIALFLLHSDHLGGRQLLPKAVASPIKRRSLETLGIHALVHCVLVNLPEETVIFHPRCRCVEIHGASTVWNLRCLCHDNWTPTELFPDALRDGYNCSLEMISRKIIQWIMSLQHHHVTASQSCHPTAIDISIDKCRSRFPCTVYIYITIDINMYVCVDMWGAQCNRFRPVRNPFDDWNEKSVPFFLMAAPNLS